MMIAISLNFLCAFPFFVLIQGAVSNDQYLQDAQTMLNLVNATRKARGISPLCLSKKLNDSAMKQSQYQAQIQQLTHDQNGAPFSQRFTGFSYKGIAENVAYLSKNDAAEAERNLEADPPHLDNIIGNYSHFGYGVAFEPVQKRYYFTQHFALASGNEPCDDGSIPAASANVPQSKPSSSPTSGLPQSAQANNQYPSQNPIQNTQYSNLPQQQQQQRNPANGSNVLERATLEKLRVLIDSFLQQLGDSAL